MKKLGQEFKAFVMRGNVVDMAVGVVIGSAFGKIVTSFVNDILMPLISMAMGKTNFSELCVVLKPEVLDEAGEVVEKALTWNYGMFIQTVLDFIIIAFCIFVMIKIIAGLKDGFKKKKKEEPAPEPAPAPEPQPTKEEILWAMSAYGCTRGSIAFVRKGYELDMERD